MDESFRRTILVELFKHPYAPEHETRVVHASETSPLSHVDYVYKKLEQIERREAHHSCTNDLRLVERMADALHVSKRNHQWRDVALVIGTAAVAMTVPGVSLPMSDLATKLGKIMTGTTAASVDEAMTERIIKHVEDCRGDLLKLQETLRG